MTLTAIIEGYELIIDETNEIQHVTPWTVNTVIDLSLSIDDIDTLQSNTVIQIGEIFLHLRKATN